MEKIPTAKAFYQNYIEENNHDPNLDIEEMLIEFAKLHVEAALKAAYENIEYTEVDSSVPYVVEDSILKSYPLTNIK
jgi:hypothetical protein